MSSSSSPPAQPDQPEPPKSRSLVLCFDGTESQYDGYNTNIVRFFSLLKKDATEEQLCYYQPGIGTYFQPGVVSPIFQWVAQKLDAAIAWYLPEHVMEGYRFIMENHRAGDKICLFGFSRGAYTARALAGMLLKVGLLQKGNDEQIPFAYKLYKRVDSEGVTLSAGFKETFCINVEIEFVGVWDTVASVGILYGRTLPFVESNSSIKTFRHALSLDEHRVKFIPNLYHRTPPSPDADKDDPERAIATHKTFSTSKLSTVTNQLGYAFGKKRPSAKARDTDISIPSVFARDYDTDVREVWFSGCHEDVGGGSTENADLTTLSFISLRWMVQECLAANSVQFNDEALQRLNVNITPVNLSQLSPTTESPSDATGSIPDQDSLDAVDAVQPIYDQLVIDKWWWILEVMLLPCVYQDKEGVWHKKWSIHMGKGRVIYEPNPLFHFTVRTRESDKTLKYTPKAIYTPSAVQFVS